MGSMPRLGTSVKDSRFSSAHGHRSVPFERCGKPHVWTDQLSTKPDATPSRRCGCQPCHNQLL